MIIAGVALSVLAVLAVGLAVARRVGGDSTNFLVAGRSLALPLSAAGLMGQAVDSNATLGNTDLAASLGFWAGAALPIGLGLCLLLTGLFFAAPMNRMGLLSLPDFYRITYGRGVELAASVLTIGSFCVLLAGNLVAGGYLFERFLGTSYPVGVLLIVAVVLTYTAAGGMFSDAYTALVQVGITVVGSLALLGWTAARYGIGAPEGMGPLDLGQLADPGRGAVVNWATLVALGVGDVVAIDFMQRILSARSPRTARRACFLGAAGTAVVGVPYALVALSTRDVVSGPGPIRVVIPIAAAAAAMLRIVRGEFMFGGNSRLGCALFAGGGTGDPGTIGKRLGDVVLRNSGFAAVVRAKRGFREESIAPDVGRGALSSTRRDRATHSVTEWLPAADGLNLRFVRLRTVHPGADVGPPSTTVGRPPDRRSSRPVPQGLSRGQMALRYPPSAGEMRDLPVVRRRSPLQCPSTRAVGRRALTRRRRAQQRPTPRSRDRVQDHQRWSVTLRRVMELRPPERSRGGCEQRPALRRNG